MKSTLVRISTLVSAFVVLFGLQVAAQASDKTNAYNFNRTNYFGAIEFFNAKRNPVEFIDEKFVQPNQVRIDPGTEYLFGQNTIKFNSPNLNYLRLNVRVTFAGQNCFGANSRRNVNFTGANPFNPDAKWTVPKAFMKLDPSVNTF
jgi:hypothetical protein